MIGVEVREEVRKREIASESEAIYDEAGIWYEFGLGEVGGDWR